MCEEFSLLGPKMKMCTEEATFVKTMNDLRVGRPGAGRHLRLLASKGLEQILYQHIIHDIILIRPTQEAYQ